MDGSVSHIRVLKRPLPKNAGCDVLLACPRCCSLRRALYGWEAGGPYTNSAQTSLWHWCPCAGLRYSSEGGYLRPSGLGRLGQLGVMLRTFGNLPRPESWLPCVFTSLDAVAAELGIEAAR